MRPLLWSFLLCLTLCVGFIIVSNAASVLQNVEPSREPSVPLKAHVSNRPPAITSEEDYRHSVLNYVSGFGVHATRTKTLRQPAILRVTKVADTDDGTCDADCSLREALANAGDNDIITFDVTASNAGLHIDLALGELRNSGSLTIVGSSVGGDLTTATNVAGVMVKRNGPTAITSRIINNTGTLTLINMTITGGSAPLDFGGGIFNSGTLTLINTTVTGNSSGGGGGIDNRGTLNATNSTISNNISTHPNARTQGGGIANSGTMTLVNTTISNNQATSGDLTRYGGSGGGIYHFNGTATLRNVTIANNTADREYGGGLYVNSGIVNLGNTLVGNNSSGSLQNGPDVWGTVNSEGYNLIGGNPLLDPNGLRDNGGATKTIALQQNSPAIDTGNGTIAGVTTDQRGFTRPIDNPLIPNAPGGDGSDIGAFEVQAGPIISINNLSLNEGDSGTSSFSFTVSLSVSSNQAVTVNFATANGAATASEDYQSVSGQLSFASGETAKQVAVLVNGDQKIESDETFTVNLSGATNATISVSNGQGTGTILNDDIAGVLQFSSANFSVGENAGVATITVTRTGGNGGGVGVIYATQNGTATAGQDYSATSGTVTFGANETSKTFTIPIINDTAVEPNETVNLGLFSPTAGGTLGTPNAATLTIIDDDTPPQIQLLLDTSGPAIDQAAALDSLLFLRDPFPVVNGADLLNSGVDRNTRVIIFLTNLQLAQGETSSSVVVNLIASNNQSYDIAAEDVRLVPGFNFTQLIFRLPDNLPVGTCVIRVRAHNQESNAGTVRIRT